jgi:toxin ParE1/3/4
VKRMFVRWTTPALDDVVHITEYIRKDNRTAARTISSTIVNSGNSLTDFPHRGRKGRIHGTREILFPGLPYILVYRIEQDEIHILRVYHGAQDYGS